MGKTSLVGQDWKSYWKGEAFQWLRENRGYTAPLTLEGCIEELEANHGCREAALAAFWNVYFAPEDPLPIPEVLLHMIDHLLGRPLPREDTFREEMQAIAYVKLHLAASVAVSLVYDEAYFKGQPLSESPSAISALETALQASKVIGTYPDEESLYDYSAGLVTGITRVELSLGRYEQGKHEEAFALWSSGALELIRHTLLKPLYRDLPFWDFSWVSQIIDGDPEHELIPYLPHSREPVDIKQGQTIFEKLKAHTHEVEDWRSVAHSCLMLSYVIPEMHDLTQGVSSFDRFEDTAVVAPLDYDEYDATRFWAKAEQFAELQMTSGQLRAYREDVEVVERKEAEKRLKRDFFDDDLWQQLEEITRNHLVSAECHWKRSEVDDMMNDLSMTAQSELPAIFPFLEPALFQREQSELKHMSNLLMENAATQAFIKGLKLSKGDEGFVLRELPQHLRDLAEARVAGAHLRPQTKPSKSTQEIRKLWLGVGQPGIFPRLAQIKRSLRQKQKEVTPAP